MLNLSIETVHVSEMLLFTFIGIEKLTSAFSGFMVVLVDGGDCNRKIVLGYRCSVEKKR